VLLYGATYACVKIAVTAILLWLPLYLYETKHMQSQRIANVESLYEVGTFIGNMTIGVVSDKLFRSRRSPIAIICIIMASIISVSFVVWYAEIPPKLWVGMMFFYGMTLGSVYYMVIITVTADLGRSHSKRATSTINGIVDGIGSVTNALGQLVIGLTIDAWGWRYGFLLPSSIAIICTLVPLSIIYVNEERHIDKAK
jgi:sugar phosphate permease